MAGQEGGQQRRRDRWNCGRCHECGTELLIVMDGEHWCCTCKTYRRYHSHGWAYTASDPNSNQCPKWTLAISKRKWKQIVKTWGIKHGRQREGKKKDDDGMKTTASERIKDDGGKTDVVGFDCRG
jgi:hypothetical protein